MKMKDLGFRKILGRLFVLPVKDEYSALLRALPGIEASDRLLVSGCVSRDHGLGLRVLAIERGKEDGEAAFIEVPETAQDLSFRDIAEAEIEPLTEREAEFSEALSELKAFEANEEVLRTRDMEFLDSARDAFHPDLVTVTLLKDGLLPEENQVRIEGLEPSMIIGTLMKEPDQDFGYHAGETVAFFVQETKEKEYRCLCNMNPSKKLSRKDLEDGSLLRDAIAQFDQDHTNDSFIEILECLRDSEIWIPCHMMVSEDPDAKDLSEVVKMVPEVLRNNGHAFLPVFSSKEEMKDFPENISVVQDSFLHALTLAEHSDQELFGIVVNAFTEPFVLELALFDVVRKLKSRVVEEEPEPPAENIPS